MSDGARNTLRRALRDLDDGIRVLLGQEPVELGIVRELLGRKKALVLSGFAMAGAKRRPGASHSPRLRRGRVRRRPGSPSLVLVE